MAHISRLGGAILAASEGSYFLIGDLKEPLDFAQHGFTKPAERDVKTKPFIKLEREGELREPHPTFTMNLEGEELAQKLVSSFMIYRNGSISERLWTLAEESSEDFAENPELKDANWLALMPGDIWDIVRDNVLRC